MLETVLKLAPLNLLATAVTSAVKLVILWYAVTVQNWRASLVKAKSIGTMKERLSYRLAL